MGIVRPCPLHAPGGSEQPAQSAPPLAEIACQALRLWGQATETDIFCTISYIAAKVNITRFISRLKTKKLLTEKQNMHAFGRCSGHAWRAVAHRRKRNHAQSFNVCKKNGCITPKMTYNSLCQTLFLCSFVYTRAFGIVIFRIVAPDTIYLSF
jgi:hypothetical protein